MGGGGSTKIKDTASQKALANIAAKRFNLYQQYYVILKINSCRMYSACLIKVHLKMYQVL